MDKSKRVVYPRTLQPVLNLDSKGSGGGIIASDVATVPVQGQTLLNKQVSEMISPDTTIDKTGAVKGTIKYINGWTDFSNEPSEQSGNYFPLSLDEQYAGKEITCEGTKTKIARDLDWVLLVKDNNSKFTFSTDTDGDILTLTFKDATISPDAVRTRAAVKTTAKKNNSADKQAND